MRFSEEERRRSTLGAHSQGQSLEQGRGPVPAAPSPGEEEEEMSVQEKDILCTVLPETPPLPYPLKPLDMARGPQTREYEIPEGERDRLLEELYPFFPPLPPQRRVYDLHQGEYFQAREYRIIRERGRNLLVSPFYPQTGGTVLDWMPNANTPFQALKVKPAEEPPPSPGQEPPEEE